MASTTRTTKQFVEVVQGLDSGSESRTTKQFVEVVQGSAEGPSDTRTTKQYIEVVQGLAQGAISSVSSECPGATSTITGTGFGAVAGTVAINAISATVLSWSDTIITFTVPDIPPGGYTVTVTLDDATVLEAPITVLFCYPDSTAIPDVVGPGVKRLGCGDYRVFLQRVGGTEILAELHWSTLRFSRRLDDMSDATVEIGTEQDEECIAHLGAIDPFTYEIAIWRDGVESWVGPVQDPTYNYDGAIIPARDLFWWFERRLLLTDRTYVATDLAEIAQQYVADALAQDPTPNISITATLTGVLGTRVVTSTLYRRAADELRELARTGLDFTAIARTIRFGGEEIPAHPLVTLTSDIFEVAPARLAGEALANDVYVLGSSGAGVSSPTVGHYGGYDIPLVQQVYSEPAILDVSSADHAAQTRWDLLRSPPYYITGRLLENAPIAFDDLIPGARVRVAQQVGFRRIVEDMRLLTVDVDAGATEDGVTEHVRLSLEPLGSVE